MFEWGESRLLSNTGGLLLIYNSVAMIVCTLAICLLAGAYRAFSMSSRGTLIPNTVSKHLVLPALSNGRHQKPLPFGNVPQIQHLLHLLTILQN